MTSGRRMSGADFQVRSTDLSDDPFQSDMGSVYFGFCTMGTSLLSMSLLHTRALNMHTRK